MQLHIAYIFCFNFVLRHSQLIELFLLIFIYYHRRSFSQLPFALQLVGVATQRELRSFLNF